ncbi:MAG: preprotein translocase subunit SecA [Erysipelotrichaceae bacterium]
MGFLDKLFNVDKKHLALLEKEADKVETFREIIAALSDDELKNKTIEFKTRLSAGETLDDLMAEAFAVVREAAKRVIGEFPYHVQVMGAVAMHQGDIAEMRTGEGKTLTSIMPVYLNALSGEGVHVVTVNEYLAQRDCDWMGEIHRFLGLSVGVNIRELAPANKRKAYECDIMYSTNSELGFDYLRDNMVISKDNRVMRPLNFALVDEVDSVLIDESRTPLIISGGKKQTANLYSQADRFVKKLQEEDYAIDIKTRAISLNEQSIAKAERFFKIENLYNSEHINLVHHINQALRANYIMQKDVEYVVSEEKEIIIVDQFTGRLMPGRAYSDGLHQAIEAKELVPIKEETSTLATITYQNFFRLYKKLAGMTGTAKTEEEEFLKTYNMRVIEIPTNRPIQRKDENDAIYGTMRAKYDALVEEVYQRHQKGQPVLVGTISVENNELISTLLKRRGIKHEKLNAKNHSREADIITMAGKKNAVTIATNMAGRGTDIKISDEVKALGGLAVLGSERHDSRRIDNQLRGRSGRQGDPGFSQFYVSLEDDLMRRFGGEKVQGVFNQLGDSKIESGLITKSILNAQKRVEGHNYDIRKTLLEYDDVLRQQREVVYEQRNEVLENENVHEMLNNMFKTVFNYTVEANSEKDIVNIDTLNDSLVSLHFTHEKITATGDTDTISKLVSASAWQEYNQKIEKYKDQVLKLEKRIILSIIDRLWVDHIDTMSKLREGIGLRSYAQGNPLQLYIQEGFDLFKEMMDKIAFEMVEHSMRLQIVEKKK